MTAPFFIVGNDRSGTTMLRLILDRSPDAAIPPESMFLTDLEVRGADAQALADAAWAHPKVALWKVPGPPPQVPEGLDASAARRFALAAPFEAYARKHGKPHWGDKTPHYVNHVGELLAIWPDARFVVVVRDGRDVALSLLRMPFGPNNAWAAAQWWARGIRAGEQAERDHPGQVLTVRYEDMTHDPAAGTQRVCAFLGLRYEERMLALQDADRSLIVADQRSWFPTLFDGVNTKAVERWRREMRPRDQGVFAALAGAELERRGYVVPTRDPKVPSPRHAGLYRRHNELMRNVNFVRLRVFQERGRELGPALARRLSDPQ